MEITSAQCWKSWHLSWEYHTFMLGFPINSRNMRKQLLFTVTMLCFYVSIFAQWSGDGYLFELPSNNRWGNFETVEDRSSPLGVFYRIIKSNNVVINAIPQARNTNNDLYIIWTQYQIYNKKWVVQYTGEMLVTTNLQALPGAFNVSQSPSGQLIAGVYYGLIRTTTKYVSGQPIAQQTQWSSIAFTISGGAAGIVGNSPFGGMLEGYVLSTNGTVSGDFVVYQEPATGGWGCLDGQILYYYPSGGNYATLICPLEYDLGTGRITCYFNRFRVNASNLDRRRGIWRPGEWILESSGDVQFIRTPTRCPDNAPTATPSGTAITGCIHANFRTKYKHSLYGAQEVEEGWTSAIFTLTSGATAPGPVSGDPCDAACEEWCRSLGKNGGKYNGSTPCLLGTVSNQSKGCDCW